jgi:hypothetical protein
MCVMERFDERLDACGSTDHRQATIVAKQKARRAPSCNFPLPKLAWGEGSRVRGTSQRSPRTPVSVTENVCATFVEQGVAQRTELMQAGAPLLAWSSPSSPNLFSPSKLGAKGSLVFRGVRGRTCVMGCCDERLDACSSRDHRQAMIINLSVFLACLPSSFAAAIHQFLDGIRYYFAFRGIFVSA